jgi:peptide/nickel transport system permease protein
MMATRRDITAAILRSPTTIIGIVLVVAHVLLAAFSPLLIPYGATALVGSVLEPPSAEFWLGTDSLGRDFMSRLMLGGRVAILVSLGGVLIATLVGGLIATLVAYVGGIADDIVMRIVDTKVAIPGILFVALFVVGFGNSIPVLTIVVGLLYMPGVIRIVRAQAMTQINLGYVKAAELRGDATLSVVMREIVPNTLDVICVEFAIRTSSAILAVSALSFLGLGITPPTPDWGLMIAEGVRLIYQAPWFVLFPSICISTLVIGLNFATEGIANALGLDAARGVTE